jgi:hypothetical protein
MKTLRTLTCAIAAAAALAFCATSAEATVTTDYSVLSISMTVSTNTGEIYKGNSLYVYQVKSHTYTTADLLHLFESADFAGTTFPSGSKIVVAWDMSGDVVVIDSHGNVLFDASTYNYPDAYFTVNFQSTYGPYSESELDKDPGHYDWAYQTTGNFTLYDDISTYIDLFGTGAGTFAVNQNWNSAGDYSTYSHTESLTAVGASSSEYINGVDYSGVVMKITASGHGNGESVLY